MAKGDVEKTSNFRVQVLKVLNGESKDEIASDIEDVSIAAVEGQIASLKGSLVQLKQKVKASEKALTLAKYPQAVFSNAQNYVEGIRNAHVAHTNALEEVTATEELIKFFEDTLKEFKS